MCLHGREVGWGERTVTGMLGDQGSGPSSQDHFLIWDKNLTFLQLHFFIHKMETITAM